MDRGRYQNVCVLISKRNELQHGTFEIYLYTVQKLQFILCSSVWCSYLNRRFSAAETITLFFYRDYLI